ncbi:MAG: hypothetical protein NZ889_02665, partial [Candidatus Pacearchaeota archaeon]|nr:hypothetical protein [Candidatus Pacearchaeota archaeon]
ISVEKKPENPNQARGKNISIPTEYLNYVKELGEDVNELREDNDWWEKAAKTVGEIGLSLYGLYRAPRILSNLIKLKKEAFKYSFSSSLTLIGLALILTGILMIDWSQRYPIGSAAHNLLMTGGMGLISSGTVLLIAGLGLVSIPGVGWVALAAFLITFAVTQLLYWLTYEEEFYVIQCLPSRPPIGSDKCDLCNEDPERPCSKTRCEILGLGCTFNDSVTIMGKKFLIADGICMAIYNDGLPPWITNIEVKDLQGRQYNVNPPTTTGPTTIEINKDNGEPIPDGTQLIIKLKLNERAFCMWDLVSTYSIVNMTGAYQNGAFSQELTETFVVHRNQPVYYVRCADAYGNANVAEYIFRFSVTSGPDLTPPIILGTDRDYNKKFRYGISELSLFIYVNENASCRWSKRDTIYELMDVSTECTTILTPSGFKCGTILTGLQSEVANYFYIRCKDSAGNVMQQSHQLVLYPTPPLQITKINPENNTIIKSCEIRKITLEAETNDGAEEGNATCYWKNQTMINQMIFSQTFGKIHKTNISGEGTQVISINCYDSALNLATNVTTFTIEKDDRAPTITRIFRDGDQLVLRTDEPATCTYSKTASCNFSATRWFERKVFETTGQLEHRKKIEEEKIYVKCYDSCMNGASPQDSCTIIVLSEL